MNKALRSCVLWRFECLTSTMALRAVSAPILRSVPGTLLLMVAGSIHIGMHNSSWVARASYSCSRLSNAWSGSIWKRIRDATERERWGWASLSLLERILPFRLFPCDSSYGFPLAERTGGQKYESRDEKCEEEREGVQGQWLRYSRREGRQTGKDGGRWEVVFEPRRLDAVTMNRATTWRQPYLLWQCVICRQAGQALIESAHTGRGGNQEVCGFLFKFPLVLLS